MPVAETDTSSLEAKVFFERYAWHLDHLAEQMMLVEHTLFENIGIEINGNHNAIENLQSIDLLRQSLEDLAILTLRLSDPFEHVALSAGVCEQISQDLKMQETKTLLACSALGKQDLDYGSLDLF